MLEHRYSSVIVSVLIVLVPLGVQVSPLSNSWWTSAAIWIVAAGLLVVLHYRTLRRVRVRFPVSLKMKRPFALDAFGVAPPTPAALTTIGPEGVLSLEQVSEAVERIDEFITRGNELHRGMRASDNPATTTTHANRWRGYIESWAWESLPDTAESLTRDKGPMTEAEVMRHAGEDRNFAAVQVAIERQITRLRRAKAQLQSHGKAGSESLEA